MNAQQPNGGDGRKPFEGEALPADDPSALFRLLKRGGAWVVVGKRANTIAYSSTCYAKAVGVLEFLDEWKRS